MKRCLPEILADGSAAIAVLLAGLLVAGWGVDAKAAAGSEPNAASPKGEPIRGEPIRKRAPAAVTNGVTTVATPGTTAPKPASTNGVSVPTGTGVAGSPMVVGFDRLASFQYTLPDGQVDTNVVAATHASSQIPDPIRALSEKFVSLKGFMLPLKVEKGLVTELLIMRDQSMCCYGTVPKINEWVSVKMVGAGVKPIQDQPVTLFGKLKVGEVYENGYLVGIYSMDGDRMAMP